MLRDRRFVILAVAALGTAAIWANAFVTRHSTLDLTFLDVGEGLCIVMRTPEGRTLVMDCGTSSRCGPRRWTSWLPSATAVRTVRRAGYWAVPCRESSNAASGRSCAPAPVADCRAGHRHRQRHHLRAERAGHSAVGRDLLRASAAADGAFGCDASADRQSAERRTGKSIY